MGGEKFAYPNSHADWRKDFLDALGVEITQSKHFPLYAFTNEDSLPTLAGMLLAAEMVIPSEDARMRKAVCATFPKDFIDTSKREAAALKETLSEAEYNRRAKNTLYLTDHVDHDTHRHMPELLKAIVKEMTPEQIEEVVEGANRFFSERQGLYNHIQQQIGLVSVPGRA
jgi:hypothetical protein